MPYGYFAASVIPASPVGHTVHRVRSVIERQPQRRAEELASVSRPTSNSTSWSFTTLEPATRMAIPYQAEASHRTVRRPPPFD